jgi:hypothetical protein
MPKRILGNRKTSLGAKDITALSNRERFAMPEINEQAPAPPRAAQTSPRPQISRQPC